MKSRYLSALAMLPGLAWAPSSVLAQGAELDLTMEVIAENQEPAGFINQIELPPPDYFLDGSANLDLTVEAVAEAQADDAGTVVDSLEETVTDSVREGISIDGTGNSDTDDNNSSLIPDAVDNILDSDLPLDGRLDDIAGNTGDTVDDVTETVDDVTDTVDDTTDTVNDTIEDGTDTVNDVVDNITGSADSNTDTTTDVAAGDTSTTASTVTTQIMSLNNSLQTVDTPEPTFDDTAIVDNFAEPVSDSNTDISNSIETNSDLLITDEISADRLDIQADAEQFSEVQTEQTIDVEQQLPIEDNSSPVEEDLAPSVEDVTDGLPGI